jgi:predicted dehydrogenase
VTWLTSSRLPILLQPKFIRKAIAAGKHVLSEKPIAKDVATAAELFEWYQQHVGQQSATWSVAENFRFLESLQYAAQQVSSIGRLLGFQMKVYRWTSVDGKYYRTKPLY